MANALSPSAKVDAIFIASLNDLFGMIDEYAIDMDFKDVMYAMALRNIEESFHVKNGYLIYVNTLCVTHNMHNKVMYEFHAPPYAGHKGM